MTADSKSQNVRLSVELDPAWADDPSVDCYECGHPVRLDEGILLPASTFGDPEGDHADSILVIHREKCE